MVVAEVVGGIVLVVAVLLTIDWLTAGRSKRRVLVRAKDENASNLGVGYTLVERNLKGQDGNPNW